LFYSDSGYIIIYLYIYNRFLNFNPYSAIITVFWYVIRFCCQKPVVCIDRLP